jgi:hypothetical protein
LDRFHILCTLTTWSTSKLDAPRRIADERLATALGASAEPLREILEQLCARLSSDPVPTED